MNKIEEIFVQLADYIFEREYNNFKDHPIFNLEFIPNPTNRKNGDTFKGVHQLKLTCLYNKEFIEVSGYGNVEKIINEFQNKIYNKFEK